VVTPLLLAYLSVTALLVLTPGATTAVVVRQTLAGGHRTGLAAAFGAAVANSTHASLAGLGLWVAVGRWPLVLSVIRLGGALYLAWLGVSSLRRVAQSWTLAPVVLDTDRQVSSAGTDRPHRTAFLEALGVNLLNPAIISFYLAVVPTFLPPEPPRGYYGLLAVSHVSMAFACHSAWVMAFHGLRRIVARRDVGRTLDVLTGTAMLWLSWRVGAELLP
jgi:threonine/homoserine/homoserine lactone efflux protein